MRSSRAEPIRVNPREPLSRYYFFAGLRHLARSRRVSRHLRYGPRRRDDLSALRVCREYVFWDTVEQSATARRASTRYEKPQVRLLMQAAD